MHRFCSLFAFPWLQVTSTTWTLSTPRCGWAWAWRGAGRGCRAARAAAWAPGRSSTPSSTAASTRSRWQHISNTNQESGALLGKGLFKRLLLFEYALNKVMLRHCVSVKQTTDPFLLRTFLPLILGNCFTKWQHYVFIFLRKTLRNLCQEAAHSQSGQPSRHGAVFIKGVNGISRNTIFKEGGY